MTTPITETSPTRPGRRKRVYRPMKMAMGMVAATVKVPHGLSASALTTTSASTARMMTMIISTPTWAILAVSVISLLALVIDLALLASVVSFGALVAFSAVNLTVIKHYFVDAGEKNVLNNLILPGIGFALTVFAVVSGLTQAPIGYLADHIGARKILLVGLTVGGCALIGLGLHLSYTSLIVCAVLLGLANSVYHPADYAILSAHMDEARMGRAFSIHTFAGFLGGAVAPAIMAALVASVGGLGAQLLTPTAIRREELITVERRNVGARRARHVGLHAVVGRDTRFGHGNQSSHRWCGPDHGPTYHIYDLGQAAYRLRQSRGQQWTSLRNSAHSQRRSPISASARSGPASSATR